MGTKSVTTEKLKKKPVPGKNGGKRKGSGRKKGGENQATKVKRATLKQFQDRVTKVVDILFDSQMTLARGQTFLYKIEKEKVVGPKGGVSYRKQRPVQVIDQREIEDYLEGLITEGDEDDDKDPNATYYYITAKEPDNKAIDSMLDRTFGKATQPIGGPGDEGEFIIKWQQ